MSQPRLLIATNNAGKVAEFRDLPDLMVNTARQPGASKITQMVAPWQTGTQILVRDVEFGAIHSVCPCTVVEDCEELTVLYLAIGTPCKLPAGWRYDQPPTQPVVLRDVVWRGHYDLTLAVQGAKHSVFLRWTADGRLRDWYINLQAPLIRTSCGFDYCDKALDILVAPDLNSWQWKDEDHFLLAQQSGQISDDEAIEVRHEGERVLELIRTRQPPFCDGWERWRPNPSWPIPSLPLDWNRLDTEGPG